jgi:glutamate racemase
LRHLRARLPSEDIVYLADQAHVPYGERSEDDLARLLSRNVAILEGEGVDAIVMGCNTTCAVASRRGWPRTRIPILDLIAAAAAEIAALGAVRVGVLGTSATIRSGAYGAAIRALAPGARVREVAAPRLVPLVEAGLTAGPAAHAAVLEALAPFGVPFEATLDVLVLACTHYPLLDAVFGDVLGRKIRRIDPARAQAERAAAWVATAHRAAQRGTGTTRYLTTGSLEPYRDSLAEIVGIGPSDTVATCRVEVRR